MRHLLFLLAGLFLLFFLAASIVKAAPYFRVEGTIVPRDATENVGTSTDAWDEGWFNRLCFPADTCRTTWPTSSTLSTSTALADTQVLFATGVNTIGSEAAFTYEDATNLLLISGNASTSQLSTEGYTYLATAGGAVGIGTTTSLQAALNINKAAGSGRESLIKATIDETSRFDVYNVTTTAGVFAPGFSGYQVDSSSLGALYFFGQTDTTNDTGTEPLILYTGRIESTGDPINGTFTSVTTRPIAGWENTGVRLMTLDVSGKLGLGDATPDQVLEISGTNTQFLSEESTTEFFRAGVGETSNQSVIGWDDSDSLQLGVYSSPTDTTIDPLISVLSTGAVGIATTTPFAQLAVNPLAGAATHPFVVGSSTATHFIVTNIGNVGIASSAPSAILSVNGSIKSTTAVSNGAWIAPHINTPATIATTTGIYLNPTLTNTAGGIDSTNYIGLLINPNHGAGANQVTNSVGLYVDTAGSATGFLGKTYSAFFAEEVGIASTSPYAQLSVTNPNNIPSFTVEDSVADASPFVIDASGNVGMGTTTPATALELDSSGSAALTSSQFRMISPSGNVLADHIVGGIDFYSDDINAYTPVAYIRALAEGAHATTNFQTGLAFYTASSTLTGVGERLRITNGGLVGIATTTPFAQFAINPISGAASNAFVIGSSTATQFLVNNSGNVGIGTTTPWATLAINPVAGAASNTFVVGSSTATHFVIKNTGRVGIGTTSPSSLLQLFSTGTSTLSVDSNSATQGGCLEIKDKSGTGYTYVYAEDGVLTASTVSCK